MHTEEKVTRIIDNYLLLNMKAAGVLYKHLKRYILAFDCDSCTAATSHRHNKVIEAAQAKKRLKAQRKLAAQQKYTHKISKPTTTVDSVLEISPITDAQNPNMTITESMARFFGHTALADEFDYSSLQPTPPSFQNGGDNWRKPTRADDL